MKVKNIFQLVMPVLIVFFLSSCKDSKKETLDEQGDAAVEQLSQETQAEEEDMTVYTIVSEMPRFPGCEEEAKTIEKYLCSNKRLNNYISNRLRYPKIALNNRVEGTVTAKFVVRPDGLVEDIQVENDIGYGCGKTVLAIIQSMNHMNERWTPGRNGGKAVRVQMQLPVEFRLMIDEDKR